MPAARFAPLVMLALAAGAFAADPPVWPQWRGPSRDGRVTGPPWPDKLQGDGFRRVWRADDLGPSYSGPVVAADRVFTTATVNKQEEVVTAVDRATGKPLWTAKWPGAVTVPFFAARNGSWVRSTPAYDGTTLFVAGMRDVLVALDGRTGAERWRLDFVKEFGTPVPDFGFVCSPLCDDTGVYVQAGGGFAKVDKAGGKVLWRALADGGGMNGSAFSSPVFATLAGRDQVVVETRTKLAGVDRATGDVLWSRPVPNFRGMNILTPITVGEDGVFTSTYQNTTQLFRVRRANGKFETADGWSLKYAGYMTTPVVVDGHAYLLGQDRRAVCVELRTGAEKWRTDERFGEYWSLVASGDKILALDNRGTLYLLRANPKEFELLDSRKVADAEAWAHLAVCGNEVFVRDVTGLSAFRWTK